MLLILTTCKTTLQVFINPLILKENNMENTFDINSFDKERVSDPASFPQCRALGYKFAKKGEVMDWRLQKRIQGCMYSLAKDKKLSFKRAHQLLQGKTLPKAFFDKIDLYLKEQAK
tara:strand:- start:52 stop:399 length:348 start_codon:yes stop_codon:yes gene_type:complete